MLFGLKKKADNYMQIWNADSEGLLDIYAAEDIVVEYTHLPRVEGIEQYKQALQGIYRSFPDMKIHVDEISVNKKENTVTVFWNYTGTHQNVKIFGVEPSGKKIAVNGMSFLQFEDNKVVHEKGIVDNLSLLMQLNTPD